ncbi:protein SanA, affects membrane permeability for vancomycin [Paenibacillus sp. 1_12]|uniref:SanA/YdcF family protein n=1 Tax=Paenibacillus sp. 1_12 TaxID=1566278 RepID=UPI0008E4E35C|nr:ElyC/SanA/YdcF family protein [Paenibacillus sp. 1_12]SFL93196.1 protein SanA, affects membrane permeability for vancomycin [Paenibacillus sp. 1_12]
MKRLFKIRLVPMLLVILAPISWIVGVDAYVKTTASRYIYQVQDAPKTDVILVLGARVYPNGSVSAILGDRLQAALELKAAGKADRFLVSGDHGKVDYDEVNAMRVFLEERDVQPQDIFMDHAGFSTYESMYRARDIFQAQKVLIVTQQYHLMRAVYTARQMGLDAYGVASDKQEYPNMTRNRLREVLARNKDFAYVNLLNPKPTHLGNPIPITTDGRLTANGL